MFFSQSIIIEKTHSHLNDVLTLLKQLDFFAVFLDFKY